MGRAFMSQSVATGYAYQQTYHQDQRANAMCRLAIQSPRDCAVRIVRDLASQYTKKRFEHRWNLLKREYARNDDTYVFHVTRHNAASKDGERTASNRL